MKSQETKTMLPVLREFPWSGTRPNCIAFCYPRKGQPFLLKGEFILVDQFLKLNGQPMLVHFKCFEAGKKPWLTYHVYGLRKGYGVLITGLTRIDPDDYVKGKHQRHFIKVEENNVSIFNKSVREVPRRWMKELDDFVVGSTVANIPVSKPLVKELSPEEIAQQKAEQAKVEKKKALKKSSKRMANVLQNMGVA
jgi:hypothetical protein